MVKGAFSPDEPLSLEHWLNSLGVASIAVGTYELAQKYAPAMIDDVAAFENTSAQNAAEINLPEDALIVRDTKYIKSVSYTHLFERNKISGCDRKSRGF